MSTYPYGALTVCFYYVTYAFSVNLHSAVRWISKNGLLKTVAISEIVCNEMNHSKHRRIIWPVSLNGWAFVKLSGSSPVAVTLLSDTAPVSSKEFHDIQDTTEYRFRKLGIYKLGRWFRKIIYYVNLLFLPPERRALIYFLRGYSVDFFICTLHKSI